jgi:hypothetical protein
MAFNIDAMTGKYSDWMRNYLFYCKVVGVPAGVDLDSNHPYLVTSANMPTQNIGQAEAVYQGNTYKVGTTTEFEDYTITFRADTEHKLRKEFLKWANLVHNPVTNVHGTPVTYHGEIALDHIGTDGQPKMKYKFVKVWVKTVGEVTLDYTNKEFTTFPVTFAYQYHTVDDVAGQTGGGTGLEGQL